MPFQDEFFDLVICPHWHESVTNTACLWSEISRVLVPEGLAVVYSINPSKISHLISKIWKKNMYAWQKRVYTPKQLTNDVEIWQLEQAYHIYANSHTMMGSINYNKDRMKHATMFNSLLHQVVLKKSVLATTMLDVDLPEWAMSLST